ncbi:unnamed protein product, partial [marine sediment metagenome]
TKILYRSKEPIFGPRESYELAGLVDILPGGVDHWQKMNEAKRQKYIQTAIKNNFMPRVTFCNGATLVNDTLRIYYGASDSVICTASADINKVINRN